MGFIELVVGIGIGMFLFSLLKPTTKAIDQTFNNCNCSFCGVHKDNVKHLITSEGTNICNVCVEVCEDLIMAQNIEKLDK